MAAAPPVTVKMVKAAHLREELSERACRYTFDSVMTHLDVEATQHRIDAEQVSDGVVYVAVDLGVGDRRP